MINILKAEFFKLRKSKTALICLLILLAYVLFEIVMMASMFSYLKSFDDGSGLLESYGLNASSALTYFANDLLFVTIIAAIVICGFYSGEHKQGLIRNSLCVGQSRKTVYLAKFIVAMIVSAAFYCIVTFLYMAVFGIIGGWGSVSVGKYIGFWFLQLLLFLSVGALIFMFSVITKSTGATIGITLGISLVFNIIAMLGAVATILPESGLGSSVLADVLTEISMLFSVGQITFAASMDLTGWRLVESISVGLLTLAAAGAAGLAVFCKQDQK